MGQTGIDKKRQLQGLQELCARQGRLIDAVFSVGDLMYQESRSAGKPLTQGKILDLPLAELDLLRRLAFTRIGQESADMENVFVNSHGVFRWDNKLFRAFELSDFQHFRPDMIVTLVDDVEAVKQRLDELKWAGDLPADTSYSLKDLLVWREEEILASEILGSILGVPHYVLGVAMDPQVASNPQDVAFSLTFEPWKKRAYLSYPISDAISRPEIWEKVRAFRRMARGHLTAFDPLMIDEKRLQQLSAKARQQHPLTRELVCDVRGKEVRLSLDEIDAVMPDIDGQIVARDYKLIDQAEMIVAYFPTAADGIPVVAGGVQSELEHAVASTKEVVIVWEADREPTPFIHQKADRIFRSPADLEPFLREISQRSGQLEMPIEP